MAGKITLIVLVVALLASAPFVKEAWDNRSVSTNDFYKKLDCSKFLPQVQDSAKHEQALNSYDKSFFVIDPIVFYSRKIDSCMVMRRNQTLSPRQ